MKKIFALALAAVMTAGMTTVAFADKGDKYVTIGMTTDGTAAYVDDTLFVIEDGVAVPYDEAGPLEGGDEIAIPLVLWTDVDGNDIANGGANATDKFEWYRDTDDAKMPKVYADWRIGEADAVIDTVKYGTRDYRYSVVVTLPENNSNKAADLEGTISIGRTKNAAEEALYGQLKLGVTYAPNSAVTTSDFDGGVVTDTMGIVAFESNAGEIEIEFGDETAMFVVNVTGQSKLNLAWNTKFDSEFASKYEYANIDFVTFEGKPSFNKTGTLYIYADEDSYIYEVTADGAKAIKAEWDEDYEAWTFKTRTLGSYAISDVELDEQTVTEDKTDDESSKTETETGKPNPDTGR